VLVHRWLDGVLQASLPLLPSFSSQVSVEGGSYFLLNKARLGDSLYEAAAAECKEVSGLPNNLLSMQQSGSKCF